MGIPGATGLVHSSARPEDRIGWLVNVMESLVATKELLFALLDQITRIKLRALHELTEEELRGDRTFSIFLIQCSNLSNNIQLKILNRDSP